MGTLDIILLICFLPALYTGLTKGFIQQIISLVSLLAGAWLAIHFSETVTQWLAPHLTISEQFLRILSFVLIFTVVVLILHLIGKLLSKILSAASLGWVNRLLGLVLALAETALVLGLLSVLFESLNQQWELVKPEVLQDSVIYQFVHNLAVKILPALKSLTVHA
ncbi:MAG: CvpA family protein [Bacteroidales bacterium]|nr:CvpA family protein [Bacteroidales bacterium]